MKRFLIFAFLVLTTLTTLQGQTPAYYFHNPANAGVNNLFFHTINGRMVFIYTQAELLGMGMPVGYPIEDIYFRHNTANTTALGNFAITMGHTSLTTPVSAFNSNFNVGTPSVVFAAGSYNYSSNAGTWNVPTNNWTMIPLSTPFVWDGVSNLAIQIQFATSSNSVIGFYADNGGAAITQYNNNRNAASASSSTSRPMVGFGGEVSLSGDDWGLVAEWMEGDIRVKWQELEERTGYELEKSSDGREFEMLEQFESGRSESQYLDVQASPSWNYYRIRSLDANGQVSYSKVAAVLNPNETELQLYPRPLHAGEVLHLILPEDGPAQVTLYDLSGRQVGHWETQGRTVELRPEVPAGGYFLKWQGTRSSQIQRVLVQ